MPLVITFLLMLVAFFSGYLVNSSLIPSHEWTSESSRQTKNSEPSRNLPYLENKFNDLNGKEVRLDNWDSKYIVLNFWGTWCPPCRKEMPLLSKLNNKYIEKNIQFLGIALDDPSAVASFLEEKQVSYPILWGSANVSLLMSELGNNFGSLPFTAIINSENIVLFTYLGEVEEEAFTKELEKLSKSM